MNHQLLRPGREGIRGLRMSARMTVAAITGAILLGIAILGGYYVAGDYVRSDNSLAPYARGLVPEGGRIVQEDASQCARSGWEGLFTLRDTCIDVYWELPETTPGERIPILSQRAIEQGWSIEAANFTDSNGQLVASRPGYVAHVTVFSEKLIEVCRTAPLPTEPPVRTCWDHITVESRD